MPYPDAYFDRKSATDNEVGYQLMMAIRDIDRRLLDCSKEVRDAVREKLLDRALVEAIRNQ